MNEFSYKTDVENTSCFIDIAFEKCIHALQLITTNIGQEFTPGFCSEFAVLSVTFKTLSDVHILSRGFTGRCLLEKVTTSTLTSISRVSGC